MQYDMIPRYGNISLPPVDSYHVKVFPSKYSL